MDTSEEYIEMCSKATEVQDLWEPKIGDCVGLLNNLPKVSILTHLDSKKYYYHFNGIDNWPWSAATKNFKNDTDIIWLSRQDQLQDIIQQIAIADTNIKVGVTYWANQFVELDEFLKIPAEGEPPDTWEQVWLQFLMFKKFNKTWDGTDWQTGEN